MTTSIAGPDGQLRCKWCNATSDYLHYHDTEWGFPVSEDRRLFEKICLESFQSGLSWRTILTKRNHFRDAFHGFDFNKVSLFTEQDIERLLENEGIVRHRGKIEATINNAKRIIELIKEKGSFAAYIWQYEPTEKARAEPQTISTSEQSVALSKDLKKRGWKFVGPTTVYAFMQAMGLVNDHAIDCVIREKVEAARKNFTPPTF